MDEIDVYQVKIMKKDVLRFKKIALWSPKVLRITITILISLLIRLYQALASPMQPPNQTPLDTEVVPTENGFTSTITAHKNTSSGIRK